MDTWDRQPDMSDIDEQLTRARMRQPARLVINTRPEERRLIEQEKLATLPDPEPILLAAARKRIVQEWAEQLRRDRLRALIASVNPPKTRPLRVEGRARFDALRAMVAGGVIASRDLTKPVKRETGRRQLAVHAIQSRRRSP
jgi:hypothetical protein